MKKITLAMALVLALTSMCTGVALAATATYQNPDEKAIYLYEYPGESSAYQLLEGEDIAQYINVDKAFSQLQLYCPSWSNNLGSMTLKLYNWKGDYSSTVAAQPIRQEVFSDYEDNSWLIFKADNGGSFPAGEYLWVLTEPVEKVGIWKGQYDNMDTPIIAISYLGGKQIDGIFCSCIVYAENSSVDNTVTDLENVIMYVDSNKAYVKGAEKTLDVPATVIDGRTLVPVRFVSESLGAVVNYIEETQTVVVEKGELVITLVIGSNEMKVNGESKILDVTAATINGRTMVPLRAIAEALGEQVSYFADGARGLIVVGPNAAVFDVNKAESFMKLYR